MRAKLIILMIAMLGFWPRVISAQNLVPNPSYELYDTCPHSYGYLYYASPWFQPHVYAGNTTNSCSSDLFNVCCVSGDVGVPSNAKGNQVAHSGFGYGGIYCSVDTFNIREYLEVELSSPLIADSGYCVEFYVSLSDICKDAVSNLGAYFSIDSLLDPSYGKAIDYVVPQVENPASIYLDSKTNWMLVSGSFIAQGGERFMTIGNFHKPVNTDSQPVAGGVVDMAYYYIDDVSVTPCSTVGIREDQHKDEFTVLHNSAASELNVVLQKEKKNVTVLLYDILGKEITREQFSGSQVSITTAAFKPGIYFIQLVSEGNVLGSRKLLVQ
jgi:hypothetical protein